MSEAAQRRAKLAVNVRHASLYAIWRLAALLAAVFGDLGLYVLYRKDLTEPLRPFKAKVPIEVKLASPKEIERIAELDDGTPALAKLFSDRVRMGQLCFIAVAADGEILGCDWVCPRPELVPGGVAVPGSGEVYTTDAFTRPEWRGQNIHPEINYRMLEDAKARGYHTAYALANVQNRRAWKMLGRVLWEYQGAYVWFRFAWTGREHIWQIAGNLHPIMRLANASYSRPAGPGPSDSGSIEARHG